MSNMKQGSKFQEDDEIINPENPELGSCVIIAIRKHRTGYFRYDIKNKRTGEVFENCHQSAIEKGWRKQ